MRSSSPAARNSWSVIGSKRTQMPLARLSAETMARSARRYGERLAAETLRVAAAVSGNGGISRSRLSPSSPNSTRARLARLTTSCTPGSRASSRVRRSMRVSVAGANTSSAKMPMTAISSLPKTRRTPVVVRRVGIVDRQQLIDGAVDAKLRRRRAEPDRHRPDEAQRRAREALRQGQQPLGDAGHPEWSNRMLARSRTMRVPQRRRWIGAVSLCSEVIDRKGRRTQRAPAGDAVGRLGAP